MANILSMPLSPDPRASIIATAIPHRDTKELSHDRLHCSVTTAVSGPPYLKTINTRKLKNIKAFDHFYKSLMALGDLDQFTDGNSLWTRGLWVMRTETPVDSHNHISFSTVDVT